MRWSRCEDPSERCGAAYWDARAKARWGEPTHGAFGSEEDWKATDASLPLALLAVASRLKLKAPIRILEVGCGYGRSYPVIVRALWDGIGIGVRDYVGLDPCEDYVAEAWRRHPAVKFTASGAMEFPEQAERFDLVIGLAVLTSIEPIVLDVKDRAFGKWLSPGGVFMLVEPDGFFVWTRKW